MRRTSLALVVMLCACATATNVYFDKDKPHHTLDGFRNGETITLTR